MIRRGQKMKRAPNIDADAIAAALPEGARWALSIASRSGGADRGSFKPEDLQAGLSWGLLEPTPKGRRFHLSEIGGRVNAACARLAAKKIDAGNTSSTT